MAGWSGLFDNKYGTPYSLQFTKNNAHREQVAHVFLRRTAKRDLALIGALLGAVPGTTATSSYTRVKDNNLGPSDIMKNGGKVTVEIKTAINRASTAADVTELWQYMFNKTHDLTLVKDKSGNGIKGDATRYF